MALCYRRHWSYFPSSEKLLDITSDGRCDLHEDPPPATLAHVGFEVVAQMLAAPLRRAFWDHLESHHCFRYFRCPEYDRLAALLPEGDLPVVYG